MGCTGSRIRTGTIYQTMRRLTSIEMRVRCKIQVSLPTGMNWLHQRVQDLTLSEAEMDHIALERLHSEEYRAPEG